MDKARARQAVYVRFDSAPEQQTFDFRLPTLVTSDVFFFAYLHIHTSLSLPLSIARRYKPGLGDLDTDTDTDLIVETRHPIPARIRVL